MKKAIFITLISILVICFLGFFAFTRIPSWLSHTLSKRAKVEITIGKIGLSSDKITIDGVQVENPKGSKLKNALKVEEITSIAPFKNYLSDNIIIDEILLEDVYFSLEFYKPNSKEGNWSYISNNLSQSNKQEAAKQKAEGKSTEVLIKKLVLTNVNIEMYTHEQNAKLKKLKTIKRLEFTNVTSSGGIPTSQIMDVIIQQALREIFSREGIQNMLENVLSPDKGSDNVFDSLKNLFPGN